MRRARDLAGAGGGGRSRRAAAMRSASRLGRRLVGAVVAIEGGAVVGHECVSETEAAASGWWGSKPPPSAATSWMRRVSASACEADEILLGLEQAEARIDRIELRAEPGRACAPDRAARCRAGPGRYGACVGEILIGRADVGDRVGRLAHRAEHRVVVARDRAVEIGGRALILRAQPAALEDRQPTAPGRAA